MAQTFQNGIVSRKVTIYRSRPEIDNEATVTEAISNFSRDYLRERSRFDHDQIWNYDQTGFNYEPANLRILSFRGERDTVLKIDSKNKHSHSYTVQPMISRDGRLFPKLLIVLQEESGNFGPILTKRVQELERKFGNIEVFATKSGKLNSDLVERWYQIHSTVAKSPVPGIYGLSCKRLFWRLLQFAE